MSDTFGIPSAKKVRMQQRRSKEEQRISAKKALKTRISKGLKRAMEINYDSSKLKIELDWFSFSANEAEAMARDILKGQDFQIRVNNNDDVDGVSSYVLIRW